MTMIHRSMDDEVADIEHVDQRISINLTPAEESSPERTLDEYNHLRQQQIHQHQSTKPKTNKTISQQQQTSIPFLSILHSGSGLKHSLSASCLPSLSFTNDQHDTNKKRNTASNSSTDEDSHSPTMNHQIFTRASMTHEWKKLKTPNKCRECNFLAYFNGRECSFCGLVAHKKCLKVLVIKCSGQRLSNDLSSGRNWMDRFTQFQSGSHHNKQQQVNLLNSRQASSRSNSPQNSGSSPGGSTSSISSPSALITNSTKPIFGQPVSADSNKVLDFIRRFVYEIDSRGLHSKDLSSFHPNIIANCLKMYLRSLPEPLMTNEIYHHFIELAKKYSSNKSSLHRDQNNCRIIDGHHLGDNLDQEAKTKARIDNGKQTVDSSYDPMLVVELREAMDSLPTVNREIVAIIMRHLKRVADRSDENQMTASNLSIIFGPTLLSIADNKSMAIVDNIHQARIVELMITWAEKVFPLYENYESKAVIELRNAFVNLDQS